MRLDPETAREVIREAAEYLIDEDGYTRDDLAKFLMSVLAEVCDE